MNLYFRLLAVLLRYLFRRRRLQTLDASNLCLRVWPSDLDLNLHMNNGRYHVMMDLGRFDLMLRMGLVQKSITERWMPVVADVKMRYRHPIEPLQRFELQTRLVGWDRKWFYLEQRFERKGRLCARALVRTAFVSKGRTLNVAEVIEAMGVTLAPPELPEEFETGWVTRPGTRRLDPKDILPHPDTSLPSGHGPKPDARSNARSDARSDPSMDPSPDPSPDPSSDSRTDSKEVIS